MRHEWARTGPSTEELVAERKDGRMMSRPDTVVIITTCGNRELLEKHINKLEKQAGRFDILIVCGPEDGFITGRASMLQVREISKNGSSGAYYIGQRIALEEGYDKIIMADDDALPLSDDLLERLTKKIDSGERVVLPILGKLGGRRKDSKAMIPHYYGTIHRKVFERCGLTYLPFFFGGDDVEFMERIISAGFTPTHVDASIWHPLMRPLLIDKPSRRYYYVRGEMEALVLSGKMFECFTRTAAHVLSAWALATMGKRKMPLTIMEALWDGSGMTFFRKDREIGDENIVAEANADVCFSPPENSMGGGIEIHKGDDALAYPGSFLSALRFLPGHLGKDVVFRDGDTLSYLPVMLVCRSAYVSFEERTYRIFSGRSLPGISLGLLLLALSIPAVILLSVLLVSRASIISSINGLNTWGYGRVKNNESKSQL